MPGSNIPGSNIRLSRHSAQPRLAGLIKGVAQRLGDKVQAWMDASEWQVSPCQIQAVLSRCTSGCLSAAIASSHPSSSLMHNRGPSFPEPLPLLKRDCVRAVSPAGEAPCAAWAHRGAGGLPEHAAAVRLLPDRRPHHAAHHAQVGCSLQAFPLTTPKQGHRAHICPSGWGS